MIKPRTDGTIEEKTDDSICCIVVYNHRFDENIEIINKLYKTRFENIYHLVPFYNGKIPNVVPVFESSHRFQGYFSQGFSRFYQERFSHYIFVADDLLLNRHINAKNICHEIGITDSEGYTKGLKPLCHATFEWTHLLPAIKALLPKPDVHGFNELPSKQEAETLFSGQGLCTDEVSYRNLLWRKNVLTLRFYHALFFLVGRSTARLFTGNQILRSIIGNRLAQQLERMTPTYPAVLGYSDFIIIPAHAIGTFCRYCGIFAAMGLFAEVAIPTSMVLSGIDIVTENRSFWKGKELWTPEEVLQIEQEADLFLNGIRFQENQLYVHPVKLSRWKI